MNQEPPIASVIDMTFGFVVPRSLHVVAELGVADRIGGEARPVAELAVETGANADVLDRMLRLLASYGFFEKVPGGYGQTAKSALLREDHPQSMRAFVRMIGRPYNWDAYRFLGHAAATGETPIESVIPGGLWALFGENAEEARLFNEAMTAKAHGDVAAILESFDFSGFGTVADIAGGAGHLLKAILAATPGTNGILFDLPHVVASFEGVVDRLELHPGDFFVDALPRADAYVLMNILHDWADRESALILRAIAKAASPGSHLLIVETVLPEGPEMHYSKLLDVHMLAVTGGRERTLAEYAALLEPAGFQLKRCIETPSPFSIVDAVFES